MKTGKFYIKKTTGNSVEKLPNCRNLTFKYAILKVDLFESQGNMYSYGIVDRQADDILSISYPNGLFVLYEIEPEN